ncbi:exo-rhamnogalacturonan lyase family protein [Pseudoduganella lutea]|uniref:Tat pathway signal sequence domain protein n=1 Tax=Pseudoduganella lutea TaxID=321985 RepID=A0A4P6L503_9BURK|nr:Tat pathway signal sequence domain protein [Pseudoduganella lutea]QBE66746.1 Tat pathway signal sequence domain protein [Pseudoduganella lutea]
MTTSPLSRRRFLQSATATSILASLPGFSQAITANTGGKSAPVTDTALRWLDGKAPARFDGATLGVPWPRGTLRLPANRTLHFTLGVGAPAMQSWPLAYWPDGSLKWTAHAIAGGTPAAGWNLNAGASAGGTVSVKRSTGQVVVTAGDVVWTVPTTGEHLVASAVRAGRVTMQNLKLVALRQDGPDPETAGSVARQPFTSKVTGVTVEQSGPVRAVLKLDGTHSADGRDWLPFSVRLYFYAGSDSVRIVHSFIYDGAPERDFIRGLGVTAQVPMTNESHDRHVRFAGEGVGIWGEAVRPVTGLRRDPGQAYKDAQVAGRALPPLAGMAKPVQEGLQWIPEWGDFSLAQLAPDGFTLKKRTKPGRAWIDANAGTRAKGLVYAGGAAGGVVLGLKDFWQRAPVQLAVRNAATPMADVTAWLWSPSAPAMDMRSYRGEDGMDTHAEQIAGLNITYEDYEAGWDAATGVARTSELLLWVTGGTPSHATLSAMAEQVANPARLVLAPQRIHQCGVFGDWDPVDTGTPARRLIEDRLTVQLDQYLREVEQHRWYGFWHYGDVMHSYDTDRHMWRYDIGGYAWDNSELSTDLWLWYSYLRTGRADLFRLAEAMTRHTGEVDVYHLGRFKGFGTRHGVQHWSDSSKQPRVSNAAYRRIYYFLTADERVGDLMRELLGSDAGLANVDISRKLRKQAGAPKSEFIDASFGTVWGSLVAAWLAEWERTGDTRWRDRIVAGMRSIAALERQWFAAGAPYDHRTGTFRGPGDKASFSNLNGVFGVVEMNAELLTLVDEPAYRKAWIQYCRTYNAPKEDIVALLGRDPGGRGMSDTNSRMTAYAAYQLRDRALALRGWREFFQSDWLKNGPARPHRIDGPAVLRPLAELSGISTNGSAQWGLAAIQHLALGGDSLDEAARAAGLVP